MFDNVTLFMNPVVGFKIQFLNLPVNIYYMEKTRKKQGKCIDFLPLMLA